MPLLLEAETVAEKVCCGYELLGLRVNCSTTAAVEITKEFEVMLMS